MDTNIDNLIQCISDSIKRKDEEIEKLKTTLAKYEYKIKELKEENEGLTHIIFLTAIFQSINFFKTKGV